MTKPFKYKALVRFPRHRDERLVEGRTYRAEPQPDGLWVVDGSMTINQLFQMLMDKTGPKYMGPSWAEYEGLRLEFVQYFPADTEVAFDGMEVV